MSAGYTHLREGDVIHVRMVVSEAKQLVRAKLAAGDVVHVARNEVVHVEPRPIAVGDTVVAKGAAHDTDHTGTIIAIHKDRAWVEWKLGGDGTPKLIHLERV